MSVLYSWAGTMEVSGWAGSSGDNKQTGPAQVHTRPPRRRPFLLPSKNGNGYKILINPRISDLLGADSDMSLYLRARVRF